MHTGSRLLRPTAPDDSPTQPLNEKFARVASADLPNGTDHRFPAKPVGRHRRPEKRLVGEGPTRKIQPTPPAPPEPAEPPAVRAAVPDLPGDYTQVLRYDHAIPVHPR